jgi:hypothetical protein
MKAGFADKQFLESHVFNPHESQGRPVAADTGERGHYLGHVQTLADYLQDQE